MKTLTIDINGICNLNCEFCYQDLDGSILPEQEVLRIVDENPNSEIIELGGGEPFLHKEILNIINKLRERDKKIHISTNGTVIPGGLLDLEEKLRSYLEIQISLHASNPELYQEITNEYLFEAVIQNIEKIKPRYSTLISSTVYQSNFEDIPEIINLSNKLGLPVRINLVLPVGKGKDVDLLIQKQVNQLRDYLFLERIKKQNRIDSPILHENNCIALQCDYGIEKKGPCPADQGKLYVSPKGERRSCEFLRSAQ